MTISRKSFSFTVTHFRRKDELFLCSLFIQ